MVRFVIIGSNQTNIGYYFYFPQLRVTSSVPLFAL